MIECSELKDTYELITNDECKSVESVIQITPGNNFVKKLSIIEPSLDDIDGDIYSSRAIMCKDLQIEEILQNSLSYLPGIEAEKNTDKRLLVNKEFITDLIIDTYRIKGFIFGPINTGKRESVNLDESYGLFIRKKECYLPNGRPVYVLSGICLDEGRNTIYAFDSNLAKLYSLHMFRTTITEDFLYKSDILR